MKPEQFIREFGVGRVMNKYHWIELGTTIPVFTVMAKSEKQAMKKLRSYLAKIGKEEIELVRILENTSDE